MTTIDASIADRLKAETAELHRHAETRTMQKRLLKGELPQEAFSEYLAQLRHVHARLEAGLDAAADREPRLSRVFRDQHRAAARIEQDLATYAGDGSDRRDNGDHQSASPATVELVEAIARWEVEQPIALLGSLYVLEGSMNGNRFIANVLRHAYQLADGEGAAYLDPYGDRQAEEWAAFKRDLAGIDLSEDEADALLDAARATFTAVADISDAIHGDAPGS